jgi:hypothetical protein
MQTEIKIKEIPEYLKRSEFYLNLEINEDNSDETITIPSINFKKDAKIRNFDELLNLLHTLRFWMAPMEEFYTKIFNFVKMCNDIRYNDLYEEFYDIEIINDIKYLHKIYFIERKSVPVILTVDNFNKICELGLIYLLKYFHKKCFQYNDLMPYNCVKSSNIECLKYLHSNGFHIDNNLINTSCLYGEYECLKYLHKNGFTIDEGCVNCCIPNHFKCLKYCLENGGKLSSTSYAYIEIHKKSSNEGYKMICKYVKENYNYYDIIKEEKKLHEAIYGYNEDDLDY